MASKLLIFQMLWLLLVVFSCRVIHGQAEPDALQLQAPRPRGRVRIPDMQVQQPPPPPVRGPMSWPNFGSVAPIALPVPVGIPVLPHSSTVHTHIPLLREQLDRNMENLAATSEATVQNAVVYGNWKPDHPLKPDNDNTQTKERVYGRLEAMLMGMPVHVVDSREASVEQVSLEMAKPTESGSYTNPYARRDSFERSQETRGRWRIPSSPISPQPPAPVEVVHMREKDPLLRAMAKEINESIETTTAIHLRPTQQTTENSWMPLQYPYPTHSYESTQPVPRAVPKVSSTSAPTLSFGHSTETTTIALNWPTDFLETSSISTERINTDTSIDRIDDFHHIDRIDEDSEDSEDYKYFDDSLNSAQMHSKLSVPETLLPQLPLNITRVGIPYEERNSAEEPTICVPLTVSETAAESATPLLVEVERIYCFPLPKVEIKTGNIRRQQHPTEMEHSTSGSETFYTSTEQTEPPMLTSVASRQSTLALFLIIGSSILARLQA